MISKSKNAKDINECIRNIDIQCIEHCGKAFLFPNDGIYGEYGGPRQDEISWSLHKKWNGIFSLGRIGQREAMLIERESFKNKLKDLTGLSCKNASTDRTHSGGPKLALNVIVSESYSKNIYLNHLRKMAEKSVIVDETNNSESMLSKAKEFRVQIKRYNSSQIAELAKVGATNFGQTHVAVKKEGIDICRGYIKNVERTVRFSNVGLNELAEDFQLYALTIELANEIANIVGHFTRTNNNVQYFVEIDRLDDIYRIALKKKSIFENQQNWGE